MRDLKRGVFEHLEITPPMDFDKRVNYMQRLLMGPALKKYKTALAECKELVTGIAGNQWMLGATKDVTMDKLWTWQKLDGVDGSGNMYLGQDRCLDFEKDIWFELGKSMWKKNRRDFREYVKYIHNDIVKPFRVGIILYTKHINSMNNLEK